MKSQRHGITAKTQSTSYDLVVIGSGPAGEKGAAQAAYFGKRVAIIESSPVPGGAAANTGTLPSKTLRETSLVLSGYRARGLYGVDMSLRREATLGDFLYREKHVVNTERERASRNIERHRIDVLYGRAHFIDAHTVRVKDKNIHSDVFLIATGSSPRRPALFPFGSGRIYDSDTILGLDHMPTSLVVVGGGVIGCEYACTFAALDIPVHLVDSGTQLLRFLDPEISDALRTAMEHLHITVHAPDRVAACATQHDRVVTDLERGATLETDVALIAAGRAPRVATLNLEAAGVELAADDTITVNEHFQTSTPHIYAAGDVIGFPALASTSMEQARLAMVHAFQLGYKKEFAPILPYGIYTIPEVSMAGETEATLAAQSVAYVTGKAYYAQNARGIIIGEGTGFLKLIFRLDDMKLLGVHVIGEQASELVHIGLTAMMMNADSDLFIRTCYNYPTLGELYKYATYDAMGRRARA